MINTGDLAEYQGRVKALAGCRCVVNSWTASQKRVRVVFRDAAGEDLFETVVKPDNLTPVGGGLLNDAEG